MRLKRRNIPQNIVDSDPIYRGNDKTFITTKNGKKLVSKKEVIRMLEKHGGLITYAARSLNCSYKVLRKYVDNNPSVQKALDTIKLINVEAAERQLRYLVQARNLGAICFTLKCQGRSRGWVENTDITLPAVPIVFKYEPATPETLNRLKAPTQQKDNPQ